MILTALPYVLFALSIGVVAFIRMLTRNTHFTYATVSAHVIGQTCIAVFVLWVTSLLGPLDNKTIALTAGMLMLEAVFRVIWRMRG